MSSSPRGEIEYWSNHEIRNEYSFFVKFYLILLFYSGVDHPTLGAGDKLPHLQHVHHKKKLVWERAVN